jgi:hypothetical protein
LDFQKRPCGWSVQFFFVVSVNSASLHLAGAQVLGADVTMPLASMSNVTSICGTPRGAGGMPTSWKRPSVLLSDGHLALALEHLDVDHVWLSCAVENTIDFLVGIVVLLR